MKYCNKCGTSKDFSEFSKCSRRGFQSKCKSCARAAHQNRTPEQIEKARVSSSEWARNNRNKKTKAHSEWKKRNPGKNAHYTALYKTAKLQRTPKWLTDEQKREIKNFYWLANDLKKVSGEEYHVDHIVPLKGKTISGLHVPWNLQVLPADLNLKKKNNH